MEIYLGISNPRKIVTCNWRGVIGKLSDGIVTLVLLEIFKLIGYKSKLFHKNP